MTSNNPITKKILKNVIKLNARATTRYSNGTEVVEGLREFKYRIHRISITSTATAHTTKYIFLLHWSSPLIPKNTSLPRPHRPPQTLDILYFYRCHSCTNTPHTSTTTTATLPILLY